MSAKMEHKPKLRERKERKLYSDDWALGDEEIEGYHTFDLDDKIKTDKFSGGFVKDMTDVDFSLSYFQKNGFNWPLLFKTKDKLGICVPGDDFTINDVRTAVGSRRMLDVMDVNTQKNVEMTMKDWQRYFESKDKDKLLNVISLEFSHTKLENLVHAPTVVRQIDWVEKVWPRHLKEAQTEATNVLEDMMYPKVQKYCLMSVGGCYTDFHIDFGGTSVWYHILKGKKIFWLIPPTEANLQLYEQWVLSGKQGDVFFGDTVEKCERIELHAGNTFFIPTGWIHAVYTPVDSLVFGGNFLHSYGIEKQLRVAQVEDTTHVPQKFRYPFFTEMLWYVLERYVHVLLGRTHLCLPPSEHEKLLAAVKKMNSPENAEDKEEEQKEESKHVHLTRYELHGLKAIVMYLHSLPNTRKNVPDLVADPVPLIQDVKTLVEIHRFDRPELAMTSKPVLEWWPRDPMRFGIKRTSSEGHSGVKRPRGEGPIVRVPPPNASKIRYRRTRCRVCENCTRPDCRQCSFCIDMTRYGGSGILKQRCKLKKCPKPLLPAPAVCYLCGLDGRMLSVYEKKVKDESPSFLMECSICFKVCHPNCIDVPGVEGVINEDYPNSWECPECINAGYDKEYKGARGRLSAASSSDSSATVGCHSKKSGEAAPPPMPTWEQLQARVSKTLVAPQWVVRPAPIELSRADAGLVDYESPLKISKPANMSGLVLLCVFKLLPVTNLLAVMRVCREWARWAIHPSLWQHITLPPNKPVRPDQLEGIVRRQPGKLTLNWVHITQPQLKWLLMRLPQLSELELEGLCWGEVREIATCYCPPLAKLNLNFVQGINDDTVALMFSSPVSKRPGFRNQQCSRLKNLTHLSLSNALITDVSVKLICSQLRLVHLDLSSCVMVTEDTICMLADNLAGSLESLDVRACPSLTVFCLPELAKLKLLSWLGLDNCLHVPEGAIRAWAQTHGYTEVKKGILARIPPTVKKVSMAVQSRLVKSAFQEILKTHIQKLSQRSSVVSPSENKTGSLAQGVTTDVPTDETPDESIGSAIPEAVEEKCDLSNADSNITSSPQASNDKFGLGDLSQESTKENSPNPIRCQSSKKDEHRSSPDRKSEEKNSEEGNRSEEKSLRCRRRPSRFADSDSDFTSSIKNPKKNLKVVTVELEDIGSSSNLSCKFQDAYKESKDEGVSPKKSFFGPKSKWLARAEASKEKSDDSFSSNDDLGMLPPSTTDSDHQPRRTQRRSRDSHEAHKTGTASKSSSSDAIKDDCGKPAKSIPSDDLDAFDKKQAASMPKKEHRREKDIITRSKKLKQQPVKEMNPMEKEELSQVNLSKKDDCAFMESSTANELEHVKMTIKTSEHKIIKRERSSSSESTHTKKLDKQKSNPCSRYSAKLRKKSSDGSPSQDTVYRETTEKNTKENSKPKKKLFKEDATCEDTRQAPHDEVFKHSSSASPSRISKRKSDDLSEHKKAMDPKCVKVKKIIPSKSDNVSSVHLSSTSKFKKNSTGSVRGAQETGETEAIQSLMPCSSGKSTQRENREKTIKPKKKDDGKDGKANPEKKRESVSASGNDGIKSCSKKVNLEKVSQKFNAEAFHKKNKTSEQNLHQKVNQHEDETPAIRTESMGAQVRKPETGHASGDKMKSVKDITALKERKKTVSKSSLPSEVASKPENKKPEEFSILPKSSTGVFTEAGSDRSGTGKNSITKGGVSSESFKSSHPASSKTPAVQDCGQDKNVFQSSEEPGTNKDRSSLDTSSAKDPEHSLSDRTSAKTFDSKRSSEVTPHNPVERKKHSKSESTAPIKLSKSLNIPTSQGNAPKSSDSSTTTERKTSNTAEGQNLKSVPCPASSRSSAERSEGTKLEGSSTEIGPKRIDMSTGKKPEGESHKTKNEKLSSATGDGNVKTDHEASVSKSKSIV